MTPTTDSQRSAARIAAIAFLVSLAMAGCADEPPIVLALPDAEGVREGTRVSYLGVEVGEVTGIAFASETVFLRLELERDVPLRMGDTISLETMGVLGDRIVRIRPGPADTALVSPGDTMRTARIVRRLDSQDILDALSAHRDTTSP